MSYSVNVGIHLVWTVLTLRSVAYVTLSRGRSISMRWGPPAVGAQWKTSLCGLQKATERKRAGEKQVRESTPPPPPPSGLCCGCLAYGAQFGILVDHFGPQTHTGWELLNLPVHPVRFPLVWPLNSYFHFVLFSLLNITFSFILLTHNVSYWCSLFLSLVFMSGSHHRSPSALCCPFVRWGWNQILHWSITSLTPL